MATYRNFKVFLAFILSIISLSLLFGCGGGGSSGTAAPVTSGGVISGAAVKGPVAGGTVTAYAVNNGIMGVQLASATTDSQGNFQISIGAYSGSVMLQLSGGSYVDEASGLTMSMSPGDVMTAVIPSVTSGGTTGNIQVTPITSMAQAMASNMTGGMSSANITAANASIGNFFMVNDILHTQPMNPLVSGSNATATVDMKNYGMAIAAMSQSAKDMGMASSSSIVTAMMSDASDGILDGMTSGKPIVMGGMMNGSTLLTSTAGTSGLATEMAAFIASPMNKSGATTTDMNALMGQLTNSATGKLPGGGTTLTAGMLSGSVYNGAMSNTKVMAYAVSGGTATAQLASATTDSAGNFSMSVGTYSGAVMLKTNGGSYLNLATGATSAMSTGDMMTAVIPSIVSGTNVSGIHMTPLTSMAQTRAQAMSGGMIDANITAANNSVGNYFMVSDIIHTEPMNAAMSGAGSTATTDSKNYGMAIAAMSEYANTIGMTDSAALISAMMQDATDGVLNGSANGTAITLGSMMGGGSAMMQSSAGSTGLANAMTQFIGTTMNKSGLTAADMHSLINQLNASNGTL